MHSSRFPKTEGQKGTHSGLGRRARGSLSVISVFDGDACSLFDGRIGVDRFPDAIERAAVLAAVKDATRRWRGGPKTGHP